MKQNETYTEQLVNALKNTRIIGFVVVIFFVVIGTAQFTGALSDIIKSVKQIFVVEQKTTKKMLNKDGSFTYKGIGVTFKQLTGAFDIEYVKVITNDHEAAIDAEHAYARTRHPDFKDVGQQLIAQMKNGEFKFVGSANWPNKPSLPPLKKEEMDEVKFFYDILYLSSENESKYLCFDITQIMKKEVDINSESDVLKFIYQQSKENVN